jgi:predicted transporter
MIMELKTLFIGIVFAMGIFAVKSGVGIHYLLTQKEKGKIKLAYLSLYSLVYLFLFLCCSYVIDRIDIISYFETLQKFIRYGMVLHVLMAGGLLIWGVLLLKNSGMSFKGNHAWVALIVPCPVCISVVFLSLSFLISYFPGAVHVAAISAYGVFMAIVLTTLLVMVFWRKDSKEAPELTIGAAMVLIAVYFFLSIIILPQFGNVGSIYRLAAHEGEIEIAGSREFLVMCSVIAAFLVWGFVKMTKKLKPRSKWI